MPKKSLHLLMVIMMLAAAAMACNTVMGGTGPSQTDLEATANALSQDPDLAATVEAAQATADAVLNGNDNGDEPGDATPTDTGDNNGNTGDDPFDGQGPADIPVLDDNPELLLADDTNLSYYVDASFDDTVDFYRTAMIDAGWEASANGDVVFAGIASLQFNNADHNALVTITTDPTSDRTFVAILVTAN